MILDVSTYRTFHVEAPYSTPKFIGNRDSILKRIAEDPDFKSKPIVHELHGTKFKRVYDKELMEIADGALKGGFIEESVYNRIKKLYGK